jgi:hypothetical protein
MEPFGAQWSQPVATDGRWSGRESGSNRRKPLPWVATGCRGKPMVRRGSTAAFQRLPPSPRVERRVPHSSCLSSATATAHPAHIPQEVAGRPRRHPRIPATPGSKEPAHGGNSRLSPVSPEAPRPACHAGGRGFESRRSRSRFAGFVPPNHALQLLHPALIPQRSAHRPTEHGARDAETGARGWQARRTRQTVRHGARSARCSS